MDTNTTQPQAPEKLSAAIRLALHDLEIVEKDPRYSVDMNTWHSGSRYSSDGKCHVCFAGSVMAVSREFDINYCMDAQGSPWDWKLVYHALDEVRRGRVSRALLYMFLLPHNGEDMKNIKLLNGFRDEIVRMFFLYDPDLHTVQVTPYDEDPVKFKRDMEMIASRLEAMKE